MVFLIHHPNNFKTGRFAGASKISGETQHDTILERGGKIAHGCHRGCTIKCSRIYHDKDGNYLTKGPEYETIWAHGADCGIDDLDAVAQLDRIDDDFGLDTIETGATIGVAMEAGILPSATPRGPSTCWTRSASGRPWAGCSPRRPKCSARPTACGGSPRSRARPCRPTTRGSIKGIGVTYCHLDHGRRPHGRLRRVPERAGVGGNVDPHSPEGQVGHQPRVADRHRFVWTPWGCASSRPSPCLTTPPPWKGSARRSAALLGREFTADDYAAGKRPWPTSGDSTRRPASPRPTTGCPTSSRSNRSRRTTPPSTCRTRNSTRSSTGKIFFYKGRPFRWSPFILCFNGIYPNE